VWYSLSSLPDRRSTIRSRIVMCAPHEDTNRHDGEGDDYEHANDDVEDFHWVSRAPWRSREPSEIGGEGKAWSWCFFRPDPYAVRTVSIFTSSSVFGSVALDLMSSSTMWRLISISQPIQLSHCSARFGTLVSEYADRLM
jgi:hypothetical protein